MRPAVRAITKDLKILEFDPAIPGKETLPDRRPHMVLARDVMEHIEPDCPDAVLETISGHRPKVVVLAVSLEPANRILPDGRNAHLILETADWWRQKLGQYFTTLKENESKDHLLFIGAPIVPA